ncbi:MAG: biotin carboxylase, partial [Alphaproteobacteria bacterium]
TKALAALEQLVLLGCTTNTPYMARILRHKAFQAGETTTGFVADHADDLKAPIYEGDELAALLAAAAMAQPAFKRLSAAPGPAREIGEWRP